MLERFRANSDDEVFDLLRRAADNAAAGTDALVQLLESWPDRPELAERLVTIEHDGDDLTHQLLRILHTGQVAAADRGDLLDLAGTLDDITDLAEEAAGMLGLYGIEAPMEQAVDLAKVLRSAAAVVADAVRVLPGLDDLRGRIETIHELENEGDRVMRNAVASLFAGGIDPMIVIRWKDVFEALEEAIDTCERVADLLTGMVLKRT